jgi:predicted PhzF superfamily epimerase YddE/YHI9
VEVNLCGHATLASAHCVFDLNASWDSVVFSTRSGELVVSKRVDGLQMDFPALHAEPAKPTDVSEIQMPGTVVDIMVGMDMYVVVDNTEAPVNWKPDMESIARLPVRGLVVTAQYTVDGYDFVSRFFAPQSGVPEDPFTGSAHRWIAPYWAGKLGKSRMVALQASQRQGRAVCEVREDRVLLTGSTALYATGFIAAQRTLAGE